MKKILIVGLVTIFSVAQIFAFGKTETVGTQELNSQITLLSDEEDELKGAMSGFASNAAALSKNGWGFFSVSYEPFNLQNLSLSGAFSLIGPWGCEIGAGYSFQKMGLEIHMSVLEFLWQIPITESISCYVGAGAPIVFTILTQNGHDTTGIMPRAEVMLNFFSNSDYGVALYARPGCLINWNGDGEGKGSGFSCEFGVSLRMPGSFLAEIISSAF